MSNIAKAIAALRKGKMVILVDDESRENEGDVILPASKATPAAINFMIRNAGGLICVALSKQRADELAIPPMVADNTEFHRTNFTVSVDAKNTTTGISAADRSRTIQALANSKKGAEFFRRPGHVFPLVGKKGGVLFRAGHTEGSLDLMQLAGQKEAAVICEILLPNGKMARRPDLEKYARKYKLPLITIEELIAYRRSQEKTIQKTATTLLDTDFGTFQISTYYDMLTGQDHVAMVMGNVRTAKPVLVRVHSECLTGDVFHSQFCDCGPQLHAALQKIQQAKAGVLLYLRQEGRGIGLPAKLKAYELQRKGADTVEANKKLGLPVDLREYGTGAQILRDLGVKKMRLMTNNPKKVIALGGHGLEVAETVPLRIPLRNPRGKKYLATKKTKLGHLL